MKKLILYGSIVIILFISLAVVTNISQTKKAEGNPFGKKSIHPSTAELMNDANYQNVILPDELSERLASGEELTVYFYSSTCPFCKETTPRLVPIVDEIGIDLKQYNLKEFEEGWNDYQVTSTPTVIHFKDGKEVDRIVGAATDEEFKEFFQQYE
ncbi:thioredoxin family protein [Bacillus solitudinis]|uniref:thioredoxin family protein n=1 Tax=Bacillus solitudinis TaxID=2014074 RepID=UPI000C24F62D|nr:thioredoxin family protein [Bacillus solitudinis]